MQNAGVDFDQVWSRVRISAPCRRVLGGLAAAAVLLDASKPDGLEQLEPVSLVQLTCQEAAAAAGRRGPSATSSLLRNRKDPPWDERAEALRRGVLTHAWY